MVGRDARDTGRIGLVGFEAEGFRDPFDLCERKVDEAFDATVVERGEGINLLGPAIGWIREDGDVARGTV